MPNRQPIGAPEILDKVLHAGKNSVGVLMASTPANPSEGFGFNTGIFYANLPITIAAISRRTVVEYSIRLVDAYMISSGANTMGEVVTIKKTNSAGTTTTLMTLTVGAGTPNEVTRVTTIPTAPAVYADLTLASGDTLSVETATLTAGAYVFVSFMNV